MGLNVLKAWATEYSLNQHFMHHHNQHLEKGRRVVGGEGKIDPHNQLAGYHQGEEEGGGAQEDGEGKGVGGASIGWVVARDEGLRREARGKLVELHVVVVYWSSIRHHFGTKKEEVQGNYVAYLQLPSVNRSASFQFISWMESNGDLDIYVRQIIQ
uniref:Uncharacterized protein n=1 Tax=Leersia perrieri TaxID=77586 RepID=A0A0D9W295_9ORYZ